MAKTHWSCSHRSMESLRALVNCLLPSSFLCQIMMRRRPGECFCSKPELSGRPPKCQNWSGSKALERAWANNLKLKQWIFSNGDEKFTSIISSDAILGRRIKMCCIRTCEKWFNKMGKWKEEWKLEGLTHWVGWTWNIIYYDQRENRIQGRRCRYSKKIELKSSLDSII